MALGAALATGRPQACAVVPGPGLLNASAALLTAYSMNAPVLALIGEIAQSAIGRGLGHLHEIRDQAGIIARLADFSARIRNPAEAPTLVAAAMRAMRSGRPGPAALECAMDVWGKRGRVGGIPSPVPARAPKIDEDAVRAAARVLGIPENTITKHPTAGLWSGQTDEDELGFTYRDADLAMVAMYDLGLSPDEAAVRTGVDPAVVDRVRERVEAVAWKHEVPHTL